jgi:hypothetical protein
VEWNSGVLIRFSSQKNGGGMVVKPVAYSAARLNEEKAVQLTCYVLEDFAPVSDFLETVRNLCDAFRGYYSVLIDRNGEIVKIYEFPLTLLCVSFNNFFNFGVDWESRRVVFTKEKNLVRPDVYEALEQFVKKFRKSKTFESYVSFLN